MTHTKLILTSLIIIASVVTKAQIAKTNIVEHFTNSNCSICANQNPGIYTTLGNNPSVLHITYHPSAPYASCVFSMANPIENDARTNFYNIYGGTPRLIVNGVLTTTANLSSTLSSLSTGMTNFYVKTTQQFITPDSILVNVIVKKIAADTMTQALLFAGAKQDTINQTTGNGESIHQDVFRKGLTSMTGDMITLPTTINDSTLYTFSYKVGPTWNANQMKSISILQHTSTKAVINAAESVNVISIPTLVLEQQLSNTVIFPNPATNKLNIKSLNANTYYNILTMEGRYIIKKSKLNTTIDITTLPIGQYILQLQSTKEIKSIPFSKQ
jgi:hypothetical protein